MNKQNSHRIESLDWDTILSLLPPGWEEQAKVRSRWREWKMLALALRQTVIPLICLDRLFRMFYQCSFWLRDGPRKK